MIKNSLKKVFIKISRLLGFEIIDQNNFVSPTLNKELNEAKDIVSKKQYKKAENINVEDKELPLLQKLKDLQFLYQKEFVQHFVH